MQYLYKGSQSQERLNYLFAMCKIKSDDIKAAASDHLVKGISKTHAALLNNVPAPNLTRALKTLNTYAELVEKIKAHDAQHSKFYALRAGL
tara:strand:+ start:4903 stop:5175 length:273 start_codon:yes stop_codon:yes gene_type:complete